jgi:hypothetical protein
VKTRDIRRIDRSPMGCGQHGWGAVARDRAARISRCRNPDVYDRSFQRAEGRAMYVFEKLNLNGRNGKSVPLAALTFWTPGNGIIAGWWRRFSKDFARPYRPELHYMRGPGPKWREKHGPNAR